MILPRHVQNQLEAPHIKHTDFLDTLPDSVQHSKPCSTLEMTRVWKSLPHILGVKAVLRQGLEHPVAFGEFYVHISAVGEISVFWDVTVVSMLANSYVHASSHSADGAVEITSTRNESKYSLLPPNFGFQPIVSKSLRPLNSSSFDFLCKVCRRLIVSSGNPCETSVLFQRLSVVIQHFNSALIHYSFNHEDVDPDLSSSHH